MSIGAGLSTGGVAHATLTPTVGEPVFGRVCDAPENQVSRQLLERLSGSCRFRDQAARRKRLATFLDPETKRLAIDF